jgi:APA family basic amino acid/polyamine antiporter
VNLFTNIIIIATLTALIPYAMAAAAEMYLFIVDRPSFSGVNLAKNSVIAMLALGYSAWAIWGAGFKPVTEGTMLLLAGIPVFLWVRWQQYRERERNEAANQPLTREQAGKAGV